MTYVDTGENNSAVHTFSAAISSAARDHRGTRVQADYIRLPWTSNASSALKSATYISVGRLVSGLKASLLRLNPLAKKLID